MKTFILVLLVIIFTGCHRSPATILPVSKMTGIMWDVIQADEFATGYVTKDSSRNIKLERLRMYRQIFSLHHVSEEEYFSSFRFYSGKPDLFKVIIDSLSEKANREQRKIHIPVQAVPTK